MVVWMKLLVQVGLLFLFSLLGNSITNFFHLKIPGSIVGLLLLFILLELKIVRLEWFELGANRLLSNLLLFFVPTAVGIIQYSTLMKTEGWRLAVVISVSTFLVMAITGLMTEILSNLKGKRGQENGVGSH